MIDLHQFSGLAEPIEIDTSEQRRIYLLIGPDGRQLRLSLSAYYVLRSMYQGCSFEALAEQLSERQNQPVTPVDVERAYRQITERLLTVAPHMPTRQADFWIRIPFLSPAIVRLIAQPLSVLFQPMLAVTLLCVALVTTTLFVTQGLVFHFSTSSFWVGYGLFIISLIAHELGHASACARYGAQPGDIGFTIYWIYPALYSDVSVAWRLKRWQRVVVDLGGLFFQLVMAAGYSAAYWLTGWEAARVAVFMILFSTAFSLNPILKFDGYWVVADALGVTNLAQQPGRIMRYMQRRICGQPAAALPWPAWVTWTLGIYSVFSVCFWGYFTWRLIPFIWQTITTYPLLVGQLINSPAGSLGAQLPSFMMSTFISCIALMMLARLIRAFVWPLVVAATRARG